MLKSLKPRSHVAKQSITYIFLTCATHTRNK